MGKHGSFTWGCFWSDVNGKQSPSTRSALKLWASGQFFLVNMVPNQDVLKTVRPQHRATNVYSHRKLIAHQCFDQLTAVKTGYPLTNITWLYRGLKCLPIEVEYFLKLSASNYQFQMIAGSSLFFPMIHMKYVVFMSLWPRTIMILISNWPRTRKFSQFFKNTDGEDLFLPCNALVTLYVQLS